MIRVLKLIIPVAAILIITGCATTINVNVLKPAELNIGPVKKIAVLNFQNSTRYRSNIADEITQKLVVKLVENQHFKVVEREQLTRILREQGLGMSGAIDPSQAAEVGKVAGVDALIMGTVTNYQTKDSGEWIEVEYYQGKNKPPKKGKEYVAKREASVEILFKVVSVESGVIIASKSNSDSNIDVAQNKSKSVAIDELGDNKQLLDACVNRILNSFIIQIAPHYVTEKRSIMSGNTPEMKSAKEYVKRGMWDNAKTDWKRVLKNRSENARKDYIAAVHNLGVYYEINGQLNKAEKHFSYCYKQTGESKFLDAIQRIKQRKLEVERLKQQTSNR